jgi:predicted regulator of Ras-like GTPase activity (Roadblock/LC7/MglB family)
MDSATPLTGPDGFDEAGTNQIWYPGLAAPIFANSGVLTRQLDDLTTLVPEIEKLVLQSHDGLVTGSSATLDTEDTKRLAAVVAGFRGLARAAGSEFGSGRPRRLIVNMSGKTLLVAFLEPDNWLAAVTSDHARTGMIACEMARLIAGLSINCPDRSARQ